MARILVLDDDDSLRTVISRALTNEGHVVEEASNGKDGIVRLREMPFDLVITDIVMPDKEGLETITELRKEYPAMPIIAMSGGGYGGSETYLRMARAMGAAKTLTKPFALADLSGAVNDVLAAGR